MRFLKGQYRSGGRRSPVESGSIRVDQRLRGMQRWSGCWFESCPPHHAVSIGCHRCSGLMKVSEQSKACAPCDVCGLAKRAPHWRCSRDFGRFSLRAIFDGQTVRWFQIRLKLTREGSAFEAELDPLVFPGQWHRWKVFNPVNREVRWLRSLEDGFNNVGGEEGER